MSFRHLFDIFGTYLTVGAGYYCLLLGALLALAGFVGWFKSLKRARLVEDLGTSTARSVAQGFLEVVGAQYQVPGQAVTAPLTGQPCTWWQYKIEKKHRSYADIGRRPDWVVIEQATSTDLILFKDATGQLMVNPEGAEVQPSVTDRWFSHELSSSRPMTVSKLRDGRYRYTEKRMRAGGRMYVMGQLRTSSGHRQAGEYAQAVSELLGQWKQDQGKLLERFDTDRSGRIDMAEWDAARAAASAEISARFRVHEGQNKLDMLCKPSDGQPFLVSAKKQLDVARKQRSDANTGLVLLAVGIGTMLYMIHVMWGVM